MFSAGFDDKNLSRAIKNELKVQGLAKDAFDQIEHLDLSFQDIESLEGIERLENLQSLTLANNKVKDLSPLAGLEKLKILDLQNNRVEDLEPLKELDHLEVLFIRNNPVDSIEVLAGLYDQLKTTDFLVKVEFKDPAFEAYIRSQLGQEEGTIAYYDLERVRTVDLREINVRDITGIAMMPNIENLIIPYTVQGLEGIVGLENLKFVDIHHNKLNQVDFLLKNKSLERLSLRNNHISNLEGMASLRQLTYLDISYNQVKTLEPLNDLGQLRSLYAQGNPILTYDDAQVVLGQLEATDIVIVYFSDSLLDLAVRDRLDKRSGVITQEDLESVTDLMASDYKISSIEGIEWMVNLVSLDLSDNNLSDLTPLQPLTQLKVLKLKNNRIEDLQPLVYLEDLTILDLKDNAIRNIGPLVYLKQLDFLYLAGNPIEESDLKDQLKNKVPHTDDW